MNKVSLSHNNLLLCWSLAGFYGVYQEYPELGGIHKVQQIQFDSHKQLLVFSSSPAAQKRLENTFSPWIFFVVFI